MVMTLIVEVITIIDSAIIAIDDSLVEQHVDACPTSDEETEDKQKDKVKASDEDAETTEDVEAAERLTAFLDGANKSKATAQMLFSFAKNDIPSAGAAYDWN